MTHETDADLKRTPLNARHRALGARMVSFGGWDMPVEYSGITDEHMAVRTGVGLFDVSHMGEVEIAGTDALEAVQRITSNDANRLAVGQAQYSALTTHAGTFVDDLLVYRLAEAHYLLVINASNIATDAAWIKQEIAGVTDAVSVNTSSRYSVLSVQGPRALEALQPLTGVELDSITGYWFSFGEVASVRATISRTGYTGEDGFELFVPPQSAEHVWNAVLQAGRSLGIKPVGLGARDTLRLEASMRLYGNDIDETTTVLEAGLGWVVGWDKPVFNGREALARQKAEGLSRRLVGFEMVERGIARRGYEVYVGGDKAGTVSSGTMTPYLKKAIGMAYVPVEASATGTTIAIAVRDRHVAARVVKMPFYKRA
jgi:aminomethyltransferase